MSIIDESYFVGEILLTNKKDKDSVTVASITQAITQYEKEILISLLGYKLNKLMITTPTIEPYKSLIEGAEFELTFDGITQTLKWEGLKNSLKESLIAYYVYYKIEERRFIKPSGVGTIKPQAENAMIVSPIQKMSNAWNKMIQLYGFIPYLWFRDSGASIIQPDGSNVYNDAPSAFNYISANIGDFPDWVFKPLEIYRTFI